MIQYVFSSPGAGFFYPSYVIMLNYTLLETVADNSVFILIFGAISTILSMITNYLVTSKLASKEWSVYSIMRFATSVVPLLCIIGFVLSFTVRDDAGAMLFIVVTISTAMLLFVLQIGLVMITRSGCLSDLCKTNNSHTIFHTFSFCVHLQLL